MAISSCPHCGSHGRFLIALSRHAELDYFECERCGVIWGLERLNSVALSRMAMAAKPKLMALVK